MSKAIEVGANWEEEMNLDFYKGKSVLVTGHTGFKGAWLCQILKQAGALVFGYALAPVSGGIFERANIAEGMSSHIGNICDVARLQSVFAKANPEIVFHLAAQPLVLDSYKHPVCTFETNVLGTIRLLECVRESTNMRSVVIITTDKVYKNKEWSYGYREIDELGGSNDPYSASKACAEIVSKSYQKSFLSDIPLSTLRAGNVIGGGDVSAHRILPDCIRAGLQKKEILIRNPHSVRPYQHVLEPLFAYLLIAATQIEHPALAGSYNIGPAESDCVSSAEMATLFCNAWKEGLTWKNTATKETPHESTLLRLDCSKVRSAFAWRSLWDAQKAIEQTVAWEKMVAYKEKEHTPCDITNQQIREYLADWNADKQSALQTNPNI